MTQVMGSLLDMSAAELDALFAASSCGEIPTGRGRGTVLYGTGTRRARPAAAAARVVLWQGKHFRSETHDLQNLLTPFGVHAVRADVYEGESHFDGSPAIVLDYSKTSWIARDVRDEMRQIGPHEYLGIVFRRSERAPVHFLLTFA